MTPTPSKIRLIGTSIILPIYLGPPCQILVSNKLEVLHHGDYHNGDVYRSKQWVEKNPNMWQEVK